MNDQFYLQDSRNHAYVGDGLSFWGFGGSGNITDLAKATSKRFGWQMVRWTAGFSALLVLFAYYGAQP